MERLVVNKTIKKAYLELQKRVSSSYVRKGFLCHEEQLGLPN